MKQKLLQWVEYVLGLLLGALWNYEKKKHDKMASEGIEQTINLKLPGGSAMPIDVLATAATWVPIIVEGMKHRHTPHEIWEQVKANAVPEVLALVETALNIMFPGVGSILALIVLMHDNAKQMTQEEVNKWMDATTAHMGDY